MCVQFNESALDIALGAKQITVANRLREMGLALGPKFHDKTKSTQRTIFSSMDVDWIKSFLSVDLPFDEHEQLKPHHGSWHMLVDPVQCPFGDPATRGSIIIEHFKGMNVDLIKKYISLKDNNGRDAMTLTDSAIKMLFGQYIYFCGQFELLIGPRYTPVHVSDFSIVLMGNDHKVHLFYSEQFDEVREHFN